MNPMSNDNLIQQLIEDGVLKLPAIIDAFRVVDRAKFVPTELHDHVYANIPLPIGYGQTISQPLTVAIMLELLQPQAKEHCLDVGAGSGWVTALLATLVGPRGRVTAVERLRPLTALAERNLKPLNLPQATVRSGDASHGWADGAPYDVIHVAAATATLPGELKQQLTVGGRLVIPVGQDVQDLALITKISDTTFTERRYPGFQFVPLISEQPKPNESR